MTHQIQKQPERIVTIPEFLRRTTLSRSTFYRMVAAGEIKLVKISSKRVGILESSLVKWLEERANAA